MIAVGMAIDTNTTFSSEHKDIKKFFRFYEKIGSGASVIVKRCQAISTGEEYACKSIEKAKFLCQMDLDDMKSEILSLEAMQTHPNVLRLEGIYEDSMVRINSPSNGNKDTESMSIMSIPRLFI